MKSKVSVLMSVYKEPREWLELSVESILNQTYDNIEFVIVIDNPENTEAIEYLSNLVLKHNIILLRNNKNVGLVKSLNRGLRRCSGDFIARMDADDISEPERIECQVNAILERNLDIIGCGVFIFGSDDGINRPLVNSKFCAKNLVYYPTLAHPTWLAKKEVFNELKGYRQIDACEDFDFLNRARIHGYRLSNVDRPLLKYRINTASISHVKKAKQYATTVFLSRAFSKNRIPSIELINSFLVSDSYKNIVEDIKKLDKIDDEIKKSHVKFRCLMKLKKYRNKTYLRQRFIRRKTQMVFALDLLFRHINI